MMSREDLARDIFKSIKPVIDFTLYDEELETQIELNYDGKFYRAVAGYIQDNYISKADHETEIQGLELEVKLLKADEVWMKKKLKEKVKLARVEVAEKIGDLLTKECLYTDAEETHDIIDEIISDNTEGEEPMQSVSELVGDDNINNQKL